MSPDLFDAAGRRLQTGALLGRGGEGAVYEISGRADAVAKIYHTPVVGEKAAKLAAMATMATPQLLTVASWPTATLHTGRAGGGAVAGIVMPKVSGYKEIHHLNGPRGRIAEFPQAGWQFLIHTGANTARAFANLHTTGTVMGDVNDRNVMVSAQGTVRLIDCDSFQISAGGRDYLCGVGMPTHTPPELQGQSLAAVRRTPNHDAFGLAVIIFQLLFMGRHPFSGRFLGAGEQPPIETAIATGRFAYGRDANQRQMAPPPHTLPLEAVSPEVAGLFVRAFVPAGRGAPRPTAVEWRDGLQRMGQELRRCPQNELHTYHHQLGSCPWCQIESGSGVMLFSVAAAAPLAGRISAFDVDGVWGQIAAVASPGPLPALVRAPGVAAAPAITMLRRARRRRRLIGGGVVALLAGALVLQKSQGGAPVIFAILVVVLAVALDRWRDRAWRASREAARVALEQAQRHAETLAHRWHELGPQRFDAERNDYAANVTEYRDLPNRRARELQHMERNSRALQLQRYLEAARIDRAKIPGIGPARMATLQSYGVETAADVTQAAIMGAPGFGDKRTRTMLDWRAEVERRFVYNAREPVAKAEIAALDGRLGRRRGQLEQSLRGGPEHLRSLSSNVQAARRVLEPELQAASIALWQAEADFSGH